MIKKSVEHMKNFSLVHSSLSSHIQICNELTHCVFLTKKHNELDSVFHTLRSLNTLSSYELTELTELTNRGVQNE